MTAHDDLRRRLENSSDSELIKIVSNERENYTDEAIALAEEFIKNRGVEVEYDLVQEKVPSQNTLKSDKIVLTIFFVLFAAFLAVPGTSGFIPTLIIAAILYWIIKKIILKK